MKRSKNNSIFSKIFILSAAIIGFLVILGCTADFISGSAEFHRVSFDSQGGEDFAAEIVKFGDTVILPTPSQSGFAFNGWFTEAIGGTKVESPYSVTQKITLYAQWAKIHTVTFNSQGGTSYDPIDATEGNAITLPIPTRSGFTFNGWFSTETGGTRFGDIFTITENITMYAQWTAIPTYTITFDSQGGSSCSPITRESGSTITLPTSSRSGFTFDGWYSGASGGSKHGNGGSSYTITRNVTMYALWSEKCEVISAIVGKWGYGTHYYYEFTSDGKFYSLDPLDGQRISSSRNYCVLGTKVMFGDQLSPLTFMNGAVYANGNRFDKR